MADADPYELHEQPVLRDPVLVVQLEGWIDAGAAAGTAMQALFEETSPRLIATFDPDTFIDYRARRPTMILREGVNSGLVWPAVELYAGTDSGGRDLLLLRGPEPDSRWREFCSAVVGLSGRLGVSAMIGLGAFPIAMPHTRTPLLSSTASSSELAEKVGGMRSSLEVPAGVESALELAFAQTGIEAVGLWAAVPHYVANMPYPAASLALLQALARIGGVVVPTAGLAASAESQRQRIDILIGGNGEHEAMVRALEQQYDAANLDIDQGAPLPSGDELAAELERFLQGESGNPPE